MSKRTPKTDGVEWLYHSMTAFNGSGYADKATPENYVASYTAYKKWKKQLDAIELVKQNPEVAYELACKLVFARDAGHTPSERNMARFRFYYDPEKLELL